MAQIAERAANYITGRPTDYTPALISRSYEYLKQFDNLSADDKEIIPSHAGLSDYIGISRSYMYKWAKEKGKEELFS